ncbi:LysE family translocator [Vasconcelosia minhoensis]|nr:LysE family translocator [Romeria gracilis]
MLILAIVPGPSDVAVVARSIAAGFRHALLMVGGILLADFLFIFLAIYGLATAAESMGSLFTIVKSLCGAYLIGLGIGSIRSRSKAMGTSKFKGFPQFSSFLSGLLITLGDPKAILFYMGLFPAFVDLANISTAEIITIMLIATITVGGVKTAYAYLAESAKLFFEHPRARRTLDIAAGGVLMGTGLWLLLRN